MEERLAETKNILLDIFQEKGIVEIIMEYQKDFILFYNDRYKGIYGIALSDLEIVKRIPIEGLVDVKYPGGNKVYFIKNTHDEDDVVEYSDSDFDSGPSKYTITIGYWNIVNNNVVNLTTIETTGLNTSMLHWQDHVYVSTFGPDVDSKLYIYNIKTDQVIERKTDIEFFRGSSNIYQGLLYTYNDNYLKIFDIETLELVQEKEMMFVSDFMFYDNLMFCINNEKIEAYDIDTLVSLGTVGKRKVYGIELYKDWLILLEEIKPKSYRFRKYNLNTNIISKPFGSSLEYLYDFGLAGNEIYYTDNENQQLVFINLDTEQERKLKL